LSGRRAWWLAFPAAVASKPLPGESRGEIRGTYRTRTVRPDVHIRTWNAVVPNGWKVLKMIWNCGQAEPAHDPCPCRPEGGNREHRWRLLGAWGGARKGTCCWCRRRGTVPVSLPCETFARGHRLSPLAAGELSCTKVLLSALHGAALHGPVGTKRCSSS
jgi:hypothetical protein